MSEWKKVKIGEFLIKENVRFSDLSEAVNMEVFGVSNVKGITKTQHKKSEDLSKYLVIKPRSFAYNPYRINVGSIGLVTESTKGLVSPAYVVFRTKEDQLLPEILFDFLKSFNGLLEINKNAKGTVRQALRYENLCNIEMVVPPLEDQVKIAEKKKIFDSKYHTISKTSLVQKDLLKNLRQQIMEDAIKGKLTKEWREQNPDIEPASQLLKRIDFEKEKLIKEKKIKKEKKLSAINNDEILFDLPSTWQWVRLGNLKTLSDYGTSEKAYEDIDGVPVLAMGNINGGKVSLIANKNLSLKSNDLPRLLLRKKDVLFNRTNSWELVGKTGIFEGENDKFTFASYLIRLRFSEDLIGANYVNVYLNSRSFRETQIEPQIIQQCGQANFNGTKLSNTLFPLPPLAEQRAIVTKVKKLMGHLSQLEEKIVQNTNNTEILKQVVLAEAFSK